MSEELIEDLDDDFDDDGWCEYCDDDDGDNQLMNGDWICNACLLDQHNLLLAEKAAKSAPGPATSRVIEYTQNALTNEHKHVPTGRIFVDLTPEEWWAFLAEHGVES